MFTRNGVRNLKEIKRGNQPKKQEVEEAGMDAPIDEVGDSSAGAHVAKKARQDYLAFKTDVARLQKNLDAFETDLKEHTMQVQLKLAYILSALDDSAVGEPVLGYTGHRATTASGIAVQQQVQPLR